MILTEIVKVDLATVGVVFMIALTGICTLFKPGGKKK